MENRELHFKNDKENLLDLLFRSTGDQRRGDIVKIIRAILNMLEKNETLPDSIKLAVKFVEGFSDEELLTYFDKWIKEGKGEVYKNPKEFAEITGSLFDIRGFRDKDFKGFDKDEAKWSKDHKGSILEASVKIKDTGLLDIGKKINETRALIPTPPSSAISQAKSLDTLIAMLDKENRKRAKRGELKKAELEFNFKDYALTRKGDESLRGNIRNLLKHDLISGGITSYITDGERIGRGKRWIVGTFYTLEIPKEKSKDKWRVYFNQPYSDIILNYKQYYPINLKAIQDTRTDQKKGYLYLFFKKVYSLKAGEGKLPPPIYIKNLLKEIGVSPDTLARPQECFKILCECISYVWENYQREKIFNEVRFFDKDFITSKGKLFKSKIITDLSLFKHYNYEQFKKEVLEGLAMPDLREVLIAFHYTGQDRTGQETRQDKTEEGDYIPV